jgi:hypothetical protein
MQLETVEPIHRGFAALSHMGKNLVRRNSAIVTDR